MYEITVDDPKTSHETKKDRYFDAFCDRTPKSVIARYYTDYSPEKLKEIYVGVNLEVLS